MTKLALWVLAASVVLGQPAPKRVVIDPASRWISIHDKDGSGAPLEVTRDILKACPSVISVTNSAESSEYTVSIQRNGYNAGSVVIYANHEVVYTFTPGHTSTLRKVANAVCEFVGKKQ